MDLTFILSAAIFTLLAIVVATSLLNGSSLPQDGATAQRYSSHRGEARGPGLGQPGPQQNGHVPDGKSKKKAQDDWCDISGSSHDHWDVVKSVLSVSHSAATQVTHRDGPRVRHCLLICFTRLQWKCPVCGGSSQVFPGKAVNMKRRRDAE